MIPTYSILNSRRIELETNEAVQIQHFHPNFSRYLKIVPSLRYQLGRGTGEESAKNRMKRWQTRVGRQSCSSNRQRGVHSNYVEGRGRQQPSHLNLPQGGPSEGRRISRDNLKTGTRESEKTEASKALKLDSLGQTFKRISSTRYRALSLSLSLFRPTLSYLILMVGLCLSFSLSLFGFTLWFLPLCLIYETSPRRFRNFMQTNRSRIERVSVSQNGSWSYPGRVTSHG